jgi:hypothetical protein
MRWQGAELDRVTGAAHADLHESLATFLAGLEGWEWRAEVSFSIYGERGVIDILAWHAASRTLLIIELKTELADPQTLAATMHRRSRLGRQIARDFGWLPLAVSTWVVLVEGSTNRRRVREHRRLLGSAFPHDGRAIRRWLRLPAGSIAALSFWSDVRSGAVRRSAGQTKRVRPRRSTGSQRGGRVTERVGTTNEAGQPSNGPQTDT